jgi:zinc D-Ala-D-Ala carboxypeptidase
MTDDPEKNHAADGHKTVSGGVLGLAVLGLVILAFTGFLIINRPAERSEMGVAAVSTEPVPEVPAAVPVPANGKDSKVQGTGTGTNASIQLADIHTKPLSCIGKSTEVARPDGDGRFFGHLPYFDAPAGALVSAPSSFGSGGCTRLHRDALAGIAAMKAAMVRSDPELGDRLVGLSCFRSIRRQHEVFCSRVSGSIAQRAQLSAPPGFSEHHTGLAIDFGDRKVPGCNLETCFATTPVGKWLLENARSYGFELSFPAGNSQGVNYEPWHWRYVGGGNASVFARARSDYAIGGGFGSPGGPVAGTDASTQARPPQIEAVVGQQAPTSPQAESPIPAAGPDLTAEDTGVIPEPPQPNP